MSPREELTTLLHSVFCTRCHTLDMAEMQFPDLCAWYLEEQTAECWTRRCHTRELEKLEGFLERLKVKEPEAALKIFKSFLSALQALNTVVANYEFLKLLAKTLVGNPETLPRSQTLSSLKDVLPEGTSQLGPQQESLPFEKHEST